MKTWNWFVSLFRREERATALAAPAGFKEASRAAFESGEHIKEYSKALLGLAEFKAARNAALGAVPLARIPASEVF